MVTACSSRSKCSDLANADFAEFAGPPVRLEIVLAFGALDKAKSSLLGRWAGGGPIIAVAKKGHGRIAPRPEAPLMWFGLNS